MSRLANDAAGYLPTPEAYEQGGYEATPGAAVDAPGCGRETRGIRLQAVSRNLLPLADCRAAAFAGCAPSALRPSVARGRVAAAALPDRQTASAVRASAPSGNPLWSS